MIHCKSFMTPRFIAPVLGRIGPVAASPLAAIMPPAIPGATAEARRPPPPTADCRRPPIAGICPMAAMLGGGAMPPTTEVRRRGVAMASRLSRSKRRWQPAGQGLDLFVIFENDSNDVDPSSPNPRTTAHCLVRREAQRDPEASASVEPNLLARQQHPMSSTTVADASDASAAGGESAADGSTPAYSPTHGQRAQRELPSAAAAASSPATPRLIARLVLGKIDSVADSSPLMSHRRLRPLRSTAE